MRSNSIYIRIIWFNWEKSFILRNEVVSVSGFKSKKVENVGEKQFLHIFDFAIQKVWRRDLLFFFSFCIRGTLEIQKIHFKIMLLLMKLLVTRNHHVYKHFMIWFHLWLLNTIIAVWCWILFTTDFAFCIHNKCTNWFQSSSWIAKVYFLYPLIYWSIYRKASMPLNRFKHCIRLHC